MKKNRGWRSLRERKQKASTFANTGSTSSDLVPLLMFSHGLSVHPLEPRVQVYACVLKVPLPSPACSNFRNKLYSHWDYGFTGQRFLTKEGVLLRGDPPEHPLSRIRCRKYLCRGLHLAAGIVSIGRILQKLRAAKLLQYPLSSYLKLPSLLWKNFLF